MFCGSSYSQLTSAASEDVVVVKMQCRTQLTLFWVDKARMNEINSGNNSVVTVTQLIFFKSSR
jgi:hypothetical protein